MARRLTEYAAVNPERRGARWVLAVEYDLEVARARFATTIDTVGEDGGVVDRKTAPEKAPQRTERSRCS